jgi:glycosyltransferase involved in cell wall biosynthesis
MIQIDALPVSKPANQETLRDYICPNPSILPKIIFTVTNDLNYDQRMHRIAGSMVVDGYEVLLVGRTRKGSIPVSEKNFRQRRLSCFFSGGFLFYGEYNLRLFFFLLFQRADIICAIDLDTILPVYFVTAIKQQKRVYDAHELFTEQKEVLTRKSIHRFWLAVERFSVPKFTKGYTVNGFIRDELMRRYKVNYAIVRNLPRLTVLPVTINRTEKWILYQGAVNEGRCFETLIPAMKDVKARLIVCGQGNFLDQAIELTKKLQLEEKILFKGPVVPEELVKITPAAYIGITLFDSKGMNQYQSLANRFFDYTMAGIPQVCVNYPEYAAINEHYQVMYPVNDTDPATLAAALNNLLSDDVLYEELRLNCLKARTILNWETEEKFLLDFYKFL